MNKIHVGILLLAGIALGWAINGNLWENRYVKLEREHAVALAAAEKVARAAERRAQEVVEEETSAIRQELSDLVAERDSLADIAQRVRAENAKLRDRVAQTPSAAGGSAPALSALILYSELLDRESARANELAGFADESRIAGLGCERMYDRAREELGNAAKQ